MKKLLIMLIAVAMSLAGSKVSARSLSPDEALSRVASQARRIGGSALHDLQLAYTVKANDADQNTVYVFSKAGELGFAVVAADDCVDQLLLGYSEDGSLDVDNLPPAFSWFLDAWSAAIAYRATSEEHQPLRMARAPRASIAPIVTTKWNQGEPYNNECPIVQGSRSVTGCVATAMAQVMKVHEWPVHGVGSHSYSWPVNGTTYTDDVDFSAATYDWDNMLDVYTDAATDAQKAAVAQLMHHCGVSCNMGYTPNESGANSFRAAMAMLEYFNYDKGLTYYARDWFTQDEWNDIVYSELSEGRPVLYCGFDITGAGHAFVCDGYSDDELFHINWGWGGMSDGYFLLPLLSPSSQGTGGGSGQSGFSFNQNIITKIKRPVAGSKATILMAMDNSLSTDNKSYTRSNANNVTFNSPIYSMSLVDITTDIGLCLEQENEKSYLPVIQGTTLEPNLGYSYFSVNSMFFPEGTYRVSVVYKDEKGDWKDVLYGKGDCTNGLIFEVTENTINISSEEIEKGEINAKFKGITAGIEGDNDIYAGHPYNIEYQITSTGAWSGYLLAGLLKNNNGWTIYATGSPRKVDITEASTIDEVFSLEIPSGLSAGDYYLVLMEYDGSGYYMKSDLLGISVKSYQNSGSGKVSGIYLSDFTGSGSYSDPAILNPLDAAITLKLTCTSAPWNDIFTIVFANADNLGIFAEMESKIASLSNVGDETYLTFTQGFDALEYNTTYAFVGWSEKQGQMTEIIYFQISSDVALGDGEAYTNGKDFENVDITYTRNFNNDNWQPLYVPFNMSYSEWADKAQVAELNNVHEYDDDHDGVIDRTVLEFLTVVSGEILPNTPYLIKADVACEAAFECTGKSLKAAPKSEGTVDCSSTRTTYVLNGIYQEKTFAEGNNYYVMTGGQFKHPSNKVVLKPYRFYMEKRNKQSGSYASSGDQDGVDDSVIYIAVDGQICGILDVITGEIVSEDEQQLYDLMGRKVENPAPGLYIRSGKKVYIK